MIFNYNVFPKPHHSVWHAPYVTHFSIVSLYIQETIFERGCIF